MNSKEKRIAAIQEEMTKKKEDPKNYEEEAEESEETTNHTGKTRKHGLFGKMIHIMINVGGKNEKI